MRSTGPETQGASHLVDVATLTGVAANAFGELISAYFAKPREWGDEVRAAAEATECGKCPLRPSTAPSWTRRTPTSSTAARGTGRSSRARCSFASSRPDRGSTSTWRGTAWMASDKATFAKGAVGVATTTLVRLGMEFADGERAPDPVTLTVPWPAIAAVVLGLVGIGAERVASVWPAAEAKRRWPSWRTLAMGVAAGAAGYAITAASHLPPWATSSTWSCSDSWSAWSPPTSSSGASTCSSIR